MDSSKKFQYIGNLVTAIGIIPAAAAALIPPSAICINTKLSTKLFCRLNVEQVKFTVATELFWFWLFCLAIGLISFLVAKKYWRLVGLVPIVILASISHYNFSHSTDPISPQIYLADTDPTEQMHLRSRVDFLVTELTQRNPFVVVNTNQVFEEIEKIVSTEKKYNESAVLLSEKITQIESLEKEKKAIGTYQKCECIDDYGCVTYRKPGERDILSTPQRVCWPVSNDLSKSNSLSKKITEFKAQILSQENNKNLYGEELIAIKKSFNNSLVQLEEEPKRVNVGILFWQSLGVAAFLALVVLLWNSGISSLIFLFSVTGTVVVASYSSILATSAIDLNFYPALVFLMISLVLRLVILVIQQNNDMQFEGKEFWRLTAKTLSLWWIIGLCAIAGFYGSKQLDNYASLVIYCIGQEKEEQQAASIEECNPEKGPVVRDHPDPADLEDDIDLSIDEHFKTVEEDINSRLSLVLSKNNGSGDAIREAVLDAFFDSREAAVFPSHLYNDDYVPSLRPPRSCKWFLPDFGCISSRYIKKAINATYENTRIRERASLNQKLGELGAKGENEVNISVQKMKNELYKSLNSARNSVKLAISNAFLSMRILSLIANVLLCVALIKSFLYIFARFYFHNRPDRFLRVEQGAFSDQSGLGIDKNFGSSYMFSEDALPAYVKRSFDVTGVPEDITIPMKTQGAIRRIFNGIWSMNHLQKSAADRDISLGKAVGFVEWRLKKGESIYMNPKHLVAFSDGVSLKTHFSVRITSIMFGRMFFLKLTGSGVVVFKTTGKPSISSDLSKGDCFEASRFIAWSAASRLGVTANVSFKNTFMTASKIGVAGGSEGVIVDAGTETPGRLGVLKFIPACLFPI